MYWTAGPAFIIGCIVFTILGLRERGIAGCGAYVASELTRLNELFWITPLNLIPLIFLVVLAIRKVPPSLAILSSALLAGVMGALLQPQAVLRFVNDPTLSAPLAHVKGIWSALANGYRETLRDHAGSGPPPFTGRYEQHVDDALDHHRRHYIGTLLGRTQSDCQTGESGSRPGENHGKLDCDGSRDRDWTEYRYCRSVHRTGAARAHVPS